MITSTMTNCLVVVAANDPGGRNHYQAGRVKFYYIQAANLYIEDTKLPFTVFPSLPETYELNEAVNYKELNYLTIRH